MNLYHQELLDHYRHPRHKGVLPHATCTSLVHNPSCGDSISWHLVIDKEAIAAVAFDGKGCVISQATASLLAQHILNRAITDIIALDAHFIITMIGMDLGPTRLKCALLSLEALHQALRDYVQKS